MPFWHRDNQTNKFTSRACGRRAKVTSQGVALWRQTEMEKLGRGQDQRLGVDPPPYNSNPLFPSYALTHCSDLTSPASPTLPLGKLHSFQRVVTWTLASIASAALTLPTHPQPSLPLVLPLQHCANVTLQWEASSVNEVTGMTRVKRKNF